MPRLLEEALDVAAAHHNRLAVDERMAPPPRDVPDVAIDEQLGPVRFVVHQAEDRHRTGLDAKVAHQPVRRPEAQVVRVGGVGKSLDVDRFRARRNEQQVAAAALVTEKEVLRLHRVARLNRNLGFLARVDRRVLVALVRQPEAIEHRAQRVGRSHQTAGAADGAGEAESPSATTNDVTDNTATNAATPGHRQRSQNSPPVEPTTLDPR
jgi:hypothetical protein